MKEFTPKKSATPITTRNATKAPNIQENFGRYDSSLMARTNQVAKIISTMSLKTKALPVINGKKSEEATTNGTNGIANKPVKII